jgi:hypothetical protein
MKTRIVLWVLLIALLLLSTGAVTGSAPPRYRLESGSPPGGNARLATDGVQAGVVSTGGAYRLATGPAPGSVSGSAGSGCCCTWLPCVLDQK